MTESRPGVDPATNEMRRDEALTEVVQLRIDRAYWKSLTAARTERVNALEAEVVRLRADLAAAEIRARNAEQLDQLREAALDKAVAELADARRERDALAAWINQRSWLHQDSEGRPTSTVILAASSAEGTDRTEGDDGD